MDCYGIPEQVKAQACKDAIMAHVNPQHYKDDHSFIHYDGLYHYEGILWYLKDDRSN
ncbi:MAG: hypothetical protein ACJASP_002064 [Roseivirga sp.]|jgi:hypothetical protein